MNEMKNDSPRPTKKLLMGVMSEPAPWWEKRKPELVSLAGNGPVCVYNGEAINDIVFDLLSLEMVDAIVHRVESNPHPKVLESMGRLGSFFLIRSAMELTTLESIPLVPNSATILFEHQVEFNSIAPDKASFESIPVNVQPGFLKINSEYFRGRQVLLSLSGPGDVGDISGSNHSC